jgi:hypothetical protein
MTCRVQGGENRTLHGIPPDATKLHIEIKLQVGENFDFRYATPKTQLPMGWVRVEIRGVWPAPGRVDCRTT